MHFRPAVSYVAVGAVALAAGAWFASARAARPDAVTAAFERLYHDRGEETYNNTYWFGVPVQKCPLDLWVFQEIMYETRPDVIVEAGTYKGGSSYYYAKMLDLLGAGRVITVDIVDFPDKPQHDRITFIKGSSTAPEVIEQIKSLIRPGERVMVFLDSDHHAPHVTQELALYSQLVTPGNYLIVEDTHFNGHPIFPDFGPGPWEAVDNFFATPAAADFQMERKWEKFLMTFNPRGFLRRTGTPPERRSEPTE